MSFIMRFCEQADLEHWQIIGTTIAAVGGWILLYITPKFAKYRKITLSENYKMMLAVFALLYLIGSIFVVLSWWCW